MKYKVLIPSAGIGSRLGNFTKSINKALITVGDKPSISHIIEKFPEDVEIVIAVGYKKELLYEFFQLSYPNRNIILIDVDNYDGEGSGLGYSILQCKTELQCPFIFCSNDTIVEESVPEPFYNWMGYAEVEDASQYRTLCINDTTQDVYHMFPKMKGSSNQAYIGLSGIYDYEKFWQEMSLGNGSAITIGESFALHSMMLSHYSIKGIPFTWHDVGNEKSLQETRTHFSYPDKINVLEKENEAIWFIEDRVIKFALDEQFIVDRLQRYNDSLRDMAPTIYDSTAHMYASERVNGYTFTYNLQIDKFISFLDYMRNFWKVDWKVSTSSFYDVCYTFYRDKTYQRIEHYFQRYEQVDSTHRINGVSIPSTHILLDYVDWEQLSRGVPSSYHGDLHFENILVSNEKDHLGRWQFYLLDWRQNFGNFTSHGDIYYDLAKIKHGLIISHEMVHNNLFSVDIHENNVQIEFYRKQQLVEFEKVFDIFVVKEGYDLQKVNILTALIYLNIAGLHHYPYCLLLFYFGKKMLYDLLWGTRVY